MAFTDTRLSGSEKSLLAGMVGKTLEELVHDEYTVHGPGGECRETGLQEQQERQSESGKQFPDPPSGVFEIHYRLTCLSNQFSPPTAGRTETYLLID